MTGQNSGTPLCSRTFSRHFVVDTSAGQAVRFHGPSSPFALTSEILECLLQQGVEIAPLKEQIRNVSMETLDALAHNDELDAYFSRSDVPPLNESHVRRLVAWYFDTVDHMYGVVHASVIAIDVEQIFADAEFLQCRAPGVWASPEAGRFTPNPLSCFRVLMICAISSASQARHNSAFVGIGSTLFAGATKLLDRVTGEISLESLQSLLLIITYCLFDPTAGDIWKLLDNACRLSSELALYEEKADCTIESSIVPEAKRRAFWTLLRIEMLTCQHYGRSCDLPESVLSCMSYLGTTDGQSPFISVMQASHQLLCIRSDIFSEVFTVPGTASMSHSWYEQKYSELKNWRAKFQELYTDSTTNIASTGCLIEYHVTVIWLDQARLLRQLADPRPGLQRPNLTASYESCTKTIEIYTKLVGAGRDTVAGKMPLTTLSANSMFLAVMTFVAHRLLATRLRRQENCDEEVDIFHGEEYHPQVQETWTTCLLLLEWCATRWPRTRGMMYIVWTVRHYCLQAA